MYKRKFYLPDVIVSEAYCWVNSPFLLLFELWLVSPIQLSWHKTSIQAGCFSAFSLNCSAWKNCLRIPQTELHWCHWLHKLSRTEQNYKNSTELYCIQLNCTELDSSELYCIAWTQLNFPVYSHGSWASPISDSFCQIFLWLITLPLKCHFQTWLLPSTN